MIHQQSSIGKFVPLLAFVFVFQISRGMTLPIFPLYFKTIDLSAIGIGLALGVYGFSFLFFEALWGFLFDKFQSRLLMLMIVLGNSIAILAFSRPSSFTELLVLELLLGMGLGGVGVFPRIAIAKVAGNLERGRIFGMLGALLLRRGYARLAARRSGRFHFGTLHIVHCSGGYLHSVATAVLLARFFLR